MQFANGYVFQNKHYTGLGLGAGVGSTEAKVQYSYNDYPASGRPPLPVHQYNPAVIAEYQTQLVNLTRQLKSRYGSGKTIWVNALGGGCRFGFNDIPIFEPTVSAYCRGDIVRSVDRDSHISGPSCVLGEFVPFTRP